MALTLPFFPLSLVAFPGERVNLHIFEPRYRELFADLQSGDPTFVIVPHVDGRLRSMGTVMRLVDVVKTYDSGELDVVSLGTDVARVESFLDPLPTKLYAGGDVEPSPQRMLGTDIDQAELLLERSRDLMLALGVHHDLPDASQSGLSFRLGHRVGLTPKQEYRLLTIEGEDERQGFLLKSIERSIRAAERTAALKRKIEMNGHFRYVRNGE